MRMENTKNTVTITEEEMARFKKLMEKDDKQRVYQRRQLVKNQLLLEKAKAAKLTVTKKEIDERIAKLDEANMETSVTDVSVDILPE